MSTYQNYADAVSQLLVGKGAAQARATENTGNLWGGAVSSIGPLALQIPQIHAQQTELKQRQQVLDANQRRVTREEAAQAALDNAFSHGTDEDSIVNLLKDTPAASLIPKVREDLQNMQMKSLQLAQAKQAIAQAEQEHMASVARYAMSVPDPRDQAGLLMTGLADSVKSNAITKEQAAKAAAGVLNEDGAPDPQRLAQTLRTMLSYAQPAKEDEFTLGPNDVRFRGGKEIARGRAAPEKPAVPTESTLAVDAASIGTPTETPTAKQSKIALDLLRADRTEDNKRQADTLAETIRHNRAQEAAAKSGGAVGKQPANAREQGRPVTSGDANNIAELDNSLNDLTTLTKAIPPGETGPMAQAAAAVPNWFTAWTGVGANAKAKQAVIDRVKQVIGKALEGGVLRKEDEYKYTKILPTIGDVPPVVQAKLDGLKKAIEKKKSTLLDNLADAGYDTSRFIARGAVTIVVGGKSYTFPSQEAADKAKAEAGIK